MTAHRFVLIRHAEATCNVLTPEDRIARYDTAAPLTPHGERQAAALARDLPDTLLGRPIFCSPLRRARDTARPLADRHGIAVQADARLAEMIAADRFDPPLSLNEWDALLERRMASPDTAPVPGVEPVAAQDRRVRNFLHARHRDRGTATRTLIVAHAFTIELAILALLGLDIDVLAAFRLRLSNTGVHVVENDAIGGPARLLLVNAMPHLGRWL